MLLLVGLMSCASNSSKKEPVVKETFSNPLWKGADPWIIKVEDKYYTCRSAGRQIIITESSYLTKLQRERVVWKCPATGWNAYNVWAPELHYLDGKWYIYFAAASCDGTPYINQRSGVLECDTPLGDYTDKGLLITGDDPENAEDNRWAIDVNVFDWKGKRYAVWSGWENIETTDQTAQHTYIAEMSNPWTLGKRHLISKAEEEWELGEAFGLQEGQESLINGDDLFVVYSTRGSWTVHYRLGALRLKKDADPLLAESWVKSSKPLFMGNENANGVGHASFTTSPDGTENWIYYHSKVDTTPGWNRDVRLQPFTFGEDGFPYFGEPVPQGELKRPSGEVEIEKEQNNK